MASPSVPAVLQPGPNNQRLTSLVSPSGSSTVQWVSLSWDVEETGGIACLFGHAPTSPSPAGDSSIILLTGSCDIAPENSKGFDAYFSEGLPFMNFSSNLAM